MIYPAVIISFAMIVMLALIAFIVPTFAKIFKDFGSRAAAADPVTVGVSDILVGYWYVMLLVVVAITWSFFRWKKSTRGRQQWDTLRLKIPMKIGDTVQKVALARWSRTFSALTASGVPLLQAIDITGKTAGNCGGREGDGRRAGVGQARRLDPRPARRTAPSSRGWSCR